MSFVRNARRETIAISTDQAQTDGALSKKFLLANGLILYPIIVLAAASAFDVGSFVIIGMGFFSFFSPAEHLLFALEALPLALLICLVALFLCPLILRQRSHPASDSMNWTDLTRVGKGLLVLALLLLVGLTIGPALYSTYMQWPSTAQVLLIVFLLLPLLSFAFADARLRPLLAFPLLAYSAVALSFSLGVSYNAALMSAPPGAPLSSIVFKEQGRPPLSVRLVRSGQRGVLMYDPAARVLRFERWDGIRSVEKSPP